jgi:hypothetical protein
MTITDFARPPKVELFPRRTTSCPTCGAPAWRSGDVSRQVLRAAANTFSDLLLAAGAAPCAPPQSVWSPIGRSVHVAGTLDLGARELLRVCVGGDPLPAFVRAPAAASASLDVVDALNRLRASARWLLRVDESISARGPAVEVERILDALAHEVDHHAAHIRATAGDHPHRVTPLLTVVADAGIVGWSSAV